MKPTSPSISIKLPMFQRRNNGISYVLFQVSCHAMWRKLTQGAPWEAQTAAGKCKNKGRLHLSMGWVKNQSNLLRFAIQSYKPSGCCTVLANSKKNHPNSLGSANADILFRARIPRKPKKRKNGGQIGMAWQLIISLVPLIYL